MFGDHGQDAMATDEGYGDEDFDGTVPSAVADLAIEDQAMFERIRVRLGMRRSDGPERIGRYELRDSIARGGMGQVYRAHDPELDRPVALKQIAPLPGADVEVLRERLRREAQVLAKLAHDHVVTVHDVGIHRGLVYLVMELVEGPTLRELQASELSVAERLRLYVEAGHGLIAAHERDIIHRDFKPDNVLITPEGKAKVGDFGLAHVLGEPLALAESGADASALDPEHEGTESRLTRSGEVLGTRVYSPPEQLRGRATDARSDQFSFCVALWEALCGARPFAGASTNALLRAIVAGPLGGAELDPRLRKLLATGLAVDPDQRHPDMATLVKALEDYLERPRARRRRRWMMFLGLTAAALGSALTAYVQRPPDEVCDEFEGATELREQYPLSALEYTPLAGNLDTKIHRTLARTQHACATDDLAGKQHAAALQRKLKHLLNRAVEEGEAPSEALEEQLAQFEVDLDSVPRAPLSKEFLEVLESEFEPLEFDERYAKIVSSCLDFDNAHEGLVLSHADLAEFGLRCASAETLIGPDYEHVVETFLEARHHAFRVGDIPRALEAQLGALKTALMRLNDYEHAEAELRITDDLLAAARVGWGDHRQATRDELAALLARDHGAYEEAERLQLRVITSTLVLTLRSDIQSAQSQLVAGLVNLGHVWDRQGRGERAIDAYRSALTLEPDDPEALVALGCVLHNNKKGSPGEARKYLESAQKDKEHDLQVAAGACLLAVEMAESPTRPKVLAQSRDALEQMLLDPQTHAATPQTRAKGWFLVAVAHALLGEFGPAYEHARTELSEEQLTQLDGIVAQLRAEDPPQPSP
ncbi:serine/threonine kinase family protein [Plesiocystis pacifica SIR-1]|uniref:Serine/threonine kinase family protein n=2 Tax=Plesiocystis pacifica TaxID=191768 RepID=A6G815_9BACT|nr:serine/threonine kinase family protein [Plesiocystis pacifica SIR-1]